MRRMSIAFLIHLLPIVAFAQWTVSTTTNTPICTQFFKQNDPRIIEDGKGGAYIAWKDERNGLPDIYLQRINREGYILWTLDGISVCDDTTDQSTPNLVSDLNGGVIITWSDIRTGVDRDIFAQRVDSNGNELWMHNGVAVAAKANREHNEKLCSDGAGGAIIVWEQEDALWDVWAQHISASGAILWSTGGIPLTTTIGNRINPKLQKDGKGGAIVTWQDKRSGDYDIYAQRVNKDGTLLWGNAAKAICAATNTQNSPKIDPSNSTGGAYITWADKRNGSNYDIYLQKVDSNGTAQFALNGMIVCNAAGNQSAADILSNKVEGVIITWKDERSGNSDIYAQRVDADGLLMWRANGLPLCIDAYDQINPNICEDMEGGAIITWQDSNSLTDFDIKAQRISYVGDLLWPASNGVTICDANDIQKSAKNISDGQGGSIFVWQDKRSGSNDIYAHHLYSNGSYIDNTKVQDVRRSEISIFPNPAAEFVQIKQADAQQIQLYNAQGNCVLDMPYTNSMISVKDLAPGLYMVQVALHSGQKIISKLHIQHSLF